MFFTELNKEASEIAGCFRSRVQRLLHERRWEGRGQGGWLWARGRLTLAGVGEEGGSLDGGGGEGVARGAGGEECAEAGGVDGKAEEERVAEQMAEAVVPSASSRRVHGAEEGDTAGVGGRGRGCGGAEVARRRLRGGLNAARVEENFFLGRA